MGTLLVFISGLDKIADPWDQLINFYRSISNTAVAYDMIRTQIDDEVPAAATPPQVPVAENLDQPISVTQATTS